MRKIILATLCALAATAVWAQGDFNITGKTDHVPNGTKAYLAELGFLGLTVEDSTTINNNAFSFAGKIEGASLKYVVVGPLDEPLAQADFVLEAGNTEVEIFTQDIKSPVVVAGSAQNLWSKMKEREYDLNEAMFVTRNQLADNTLTQEQRDKAQADMARLERERVDFHFQTIKENVPSAFSDMLLGFYFDEMTKAQRDELLALMKAKKANFPVYRHINNQLEAKQRTAAGQQYTDFSLPDASGKRTALSEYVKRNKLTMIDFWASWCGPCRAEMPHVKKVYEAFHSKGFEIVGVSLDSKKDLWLGAVKQMKMPWPQVCDLLVWKSPAAAAYNVSAIPATVLINQNGEIVARDLRGDDLYNQVAELLK